MRVVAGGSRGWRDVAAIRERLRGLASGYVELIVGDAPDGADPIIEVAGEALGFDVHVFAADWKEQGRSAGHIRNARMLDENPELVLAFWDGRSPGTAGLIREARRRGLAVEVVPG